MMKLVTSIQTVQSRSASSVASRPASPACESKSQAQNTVLPSDRTTLSEPAESTAAPRVLFREAARLGLLAAGASIAGTVGQALSAAACEDLSQLLHEIETAGFNFGKARNPDERPDGGWKQSAEKVRDLVLESNGDWASGHKTSPNSTYYSGDELVVTGPGVQAARVTSLHDLQALEALCLTHQPDALPDPELARSVMHLEQAGVEFSLRNPRAPREARPAGAYGAYRALTATPEMAPQESEMLTAARQGCVPLTTSSPEDLDPMRFFVLQEEMPEMKDDAQARALRRLEQKGHSFHYRWEEPGRQHSPSEVWKQLHNGGDPMLRIGVRGAALEEATLEQLQDPDFGSPRLRELSAYFEDTLAPRLADGALNEPEADLWMQAIAEPIGSLSLRERGRMLDEMAGLEAEIGTEPASRVPIASQALRALGESIGDGHPAAALEEWKNLRPAIANSGVALDTLRHVLVQLPHYSFGKEQRDRQRDQLIRVCSLASTFEQGQRALERIEMTLPFDQGAALLERLTGNHNTVTTPPEEPDAPDPLERALEDYGQILRYRAPDESLDRTSLTLERLQQALPAEVAPQAFRSLQSGWSSDAFPYEDKLEVVSLFVGEWFRSGDLGSARAAALEAPPSGDAGPVGSEGARGALLERLTTHHEGLRAAAGMDTEVEPGPTGRALADYALVLRNRAPGESLEEAGHTLEILQQALPHEDYQVGREGFGSIQTARRKHSPSGGDRLEVIGLFLGEWFATGDLDTACQAASEPPLWDKPLDSEPSRAGLLQRLTLHHQDTSGDEASARGLALADYGQVLRYRVPGESLDEACDLLQLLQEALPPAEDRHAARAAFQFVQAGRNGEVFPYQDKLEVAGRYLGAWFATNESSEAREAALRPPSPGRPTASESAREALLERLRTAHGLRPTLPDTPGPSGRALADYAMVLECRAPGESLEEACSTMEAMYKMLLPEEGWRASREAFQFIQRGWERGTFPLETKSDVVNKFLEAWILSKDLEQARSAVLHPPESGSGRIEERDEYVIINGIRVRRRR